MLMRSLRRAFQPSRLPSTTTILVVLISSTALTILSILGKIDDAVKLSGILAILAFMAFSEVLERMGALSAMEEDISYIKRMLPVSIPRFSQTNEFAQFEEFVKDGKDVLIVGLTKIGLVVQRINFFSKLIKSGCSVRLALLDPEEENLYRIVSRNLEITESRFLTDISQTLETLRVLRSNLTPHENERLKIKTFAGSPGLGLVSVDGKETTGRVQVYFYAYKTDPANRPGLEIYKHQDPIWLDYFVRRYEALWEDLERSTKPDSTLLNSQSKGER